MAKSVLELIQLGTHAEEEGQLGEAAKLWEQAMRAVPPDDTDGLAGSLCINLGQVATVRGNIFDAVKWYGLAITKLAGLKGDAVLQRAHAYYNISRHLLDLGLKVAAVDASDQAVRLFEAYPYTSELYLVTAKARQVVVHASCEETIDLKEVASVWHALKLLPCQELDLDAATNFLSLVYSLRQATGESTEDLRDWSPAAYLRVLSMYR